MAPGRPGTIRLLLDGPGPGAWNMALDEALMRAARDGQVTLRLYRWDPPCLSFGRNQEVRGRYDRTAAAARGIEFVRRPTGGRAVYHDRELTYAITAPDRTWGGPRRAYVRINRALGRGLRRLGVRVGLATRDAAARGAGAQPGDRDSAGVPTGPGACFADPTPGEVTALGRKLVGSAMCRRAGALLQHGSLLLQDDQDVAEALRAPEPTDRELRLAGPRREPGRGSIGLVETVGVAPSVEALVEALVEGFAVEFGLTVRPGGLSTEERRETRRLASRYADHDWTWRR